MNKRRALQIGFHSNLGFIGNFGLGIEILAFLNFLMKSNLPSFEIIIFVVLLHYENNYHTDYSYFTNLC